MSKYVFLIVGLMSFIFFFFHAEDGIRDGHVTGVQTCALPISPTMAGLLAHTPPSTSRTWSLGRQNAGKNVGAAVVAAATCHSSTRQSRFSRSWCGVLNR